jgi:hypothetical protein
LLKGSPPVAPQRPHPLSGANRGRPLRICGRSGTTRRQPFPTGYGTCVVRGTTAGCWRPKSRHRARHSACTVDTDGRSAALDRSAERGATAARATLPPSSATRFSPRLRGARRFPPRAPRERGATPAKAAWRRRGAARHAPPRCPQGSAPPRRRASSHADAPPRFSPPAPHATSRVTPRPAGRAPPARRSVAPRRATTSVQERRTSQ